MASGVLAAFPANAARAPRNLCAWWIAPPPVAPRAAPSVSPQAGASVHPLKASWSLRGLRSSLALVGAGTGLAAGLRGPVSEGVSPPELLPGPVHAIHRLEACPCGEWARGRSPPGPGAGCWRLGGCGCWVLGVSQDLAFSLVSHQSPRVKVGDRAEEATGLEPGSLATVSLAEGHCLHCSPPGRC